LLTVPSIDVRDEGESRIWRESGGHVNGAVYDVLLLETIEGDRGPILAVGMQRTRLRLRGLPADARLRALALEALAQQGYMHEAEEAFTDRKQAFRQALREAHAAGVTPSQLGDLLGLTRGRIHQLLGPVSTSLAPD